MRVLFTMTAARGSVTPLAPLADRLRDAGHQVAFASAGSCRAEIEAAGFGFFAAGLDYHASDPAYPQNVCASAGLVFPAVTGLDRLAWVTANLFIGVIARRMLPDVIEIARQWRPALIVRESLEFSGCVAAEALGLPHASVAAAANCALDHSDFLAGPLAPLRADVGLPPDDGGMPYRHLHLSFCPPRFDGPEALFPSTVRFVRHEIRTPSDTRLPESLRDVGDRPVVLVSMGTIFHRTPGVYEAVVGGLRDEQVTALVAVGFDQDPARLGPQPPHIRIEPFLPLTLLLPAAALFVTHGGFNSIKEALTFGVPLVVVPLASDQFYSAQRCAALGLAEVIAPDERTPDHLRKAVRTVLHDPAYEHRAEEMRGEMAALAPIDEATRLLEALVR